MRVTKYEHACLDIEQDGKRLIVDPGSFTQSLDNLDNICAVVVTHVHPDHFNPGLLEQIQNASPEAVIYTVNDVAKELGPLKHQAVSAGTSNLCGVFHVSFFGGEHARIHESYPTTGNVGILVNSKLYYPGDSFVKPDDSKVEVLAVPACAPWMKLSESMDFITALTPKTVFPTHNAVLSEIGEGIYYRMLEGATSQINAEFKILKPGEFIEV